MHTELTKLYKSWSKTEPDKIEALPLSGSDRKYCRIFGENHTVLGVYNPNIKENQAYISFTHHFMKFDVPVPKVLDQSKDGLYYLVEDLGDETLFHRVTACNGTLTTEVKDLYKKALKNLVKMQVSAGKSVDYSKSYPIQRFNEQAIQWDLNYFKYNYLKLSGVSFDEHLLEKDFDTLKAFLLSVPSSYFMFRDFQARNIIIKDDEPWFIDFQGGREGPLSYDVASLLYQAKAKIPYETRLEFFNYYFEELNKVLTVDYDTLLPNFKGFAVLRTLQVLGAYGFRGYFEKKPHFIESIPFALQNLKFLLLSRELPVALPHLKEITSKLLEPITLKEENKDKLTIRITSFSYRKGIPADPTPNGGGFVFDCRGIHNPGRYEQYQNLTGLDEDVIDFFNTKTNIKDYLEAVIQTTSSSIETYLERDFKHLMVSFGCTGGQHRSVYCAQNFADYVVNNFPVNVVLWHREQGILKEYDEKV